MDNFIYSCGVLECFFSGCLPYGNVKRVKKLLKFLTIESLKMNEEQIIDIDKKELDILELKRKAEELYKLSDSHWSEIGKIRITMGISKQQTEEMYSDLSRRIRYLEEDKSERYLNEQRRNEFIGILIKTLLSLSTSFLCGFMFCRFWG